MDYSQGWKSQAADRFVSFPMTLGDLERRHEGSNFSGSSQYVRLVPCDLERPNSTWWHTGYLTCFYVVRHAPGSRERVARVPQIFEILHPRGLTQNDEVRHGNTYGEDVVSWGQTRPYHKGRAPSAPQNFWIPTYLHTVWPRTTKFGMVN